jgi:hypothetical protein
LPGAPAWAKEELERNVFFKASPTPEILELRVGAQVMLTRNDPTDSTLVNGSRGVVRGFEERQDAIAAVRRELAHLRSNRWACAAAGAGDGGGGGGGGAKEAAAREAELVTRLVGLESGREEAYPVVWFERLGGGGAGGKGRGGKLRTVGPEAFECEVYMTGLCLRSQVLPPNPDAPPAPRAPNPDGPRTPTPQPPPPTPKASKRRVDANPRRLKRTAKR